MAGPLSSEIGVMGLRIVALGAMMVTTTHPQHRTNPNPICCIKLVYCHIVHSLTPLILTHCSNAVTAQMYITVSDLLSSPSTPVLTADIPTGATGNIHCVLIGIAAVGAPPH